jgi:hypothetical protein
VQTFVIERPGRERRRGFFRDERARLVMNATGQSVHDERKQRRPAECGEKVLENHQMIIQPLSCARVKAGAAFTGAGSTYYGFIP